ncbi:MAG: phosphogluconate dehydrogenase (NAD(+)-dependent, decarboxylating) [Halobacteriaceae archaeon]
MELGVIGLGRMGQIIVDRASQAGHDVYGYDVDAETREDIIHYGGEPVGSIDKLYSAFQNSAHIWCMVPAGEAVDAIIDDLRSRVENDDIIIDGGNSHFEASIRRAESLAAGYLDCGTSGGPAGAERGFSLMIGGPEWAYEEMQPIFNAVATGQDGHAHLGSQGAGHYAKMVHNGIEYALMQAYGEGFELLANGRYDFDLQTLAETWNNGAVIRSWLLSLCEEAFEEEGNDLGDVDDYIGGGSTGSWAVREAIEQEVPMPLIYLALSERFSSRDDRFSRRLVNRLRHGFGDHSVYRRG